jgi:hypothetical protein
MKKKDEMKFSNTVGGAAMMPAEETPSESVSVEDLMADGGWDVDKISPSMRETYFSKPKPNPEEDNEDETYDVDGGQSIADEEGYDADDDEDVEFDAASAAGEEESDQERPTDDDGPNGGVPALSTKDIVLAINAIARRTVEKGKLEIGQYVFEIVFKGDIKEVLSKNPNKSSSLRAICEDKDLMVDHRKLGSWVKAAALRSDLEANGVDISEFTLSHFLAILKLGTAEKRLQLAQQVEQAGLSARQTADEVEAAKKKSPAPGKGENLLKKMDDPFSLFDDKDDKEFLSDKARLEKELDSEQRLRIIKAIDERLGRMTEVNEFLETSKRNLIAIEMENLNGGSQ